MQLTGRDILSAYDHSYDVLEFFSEFQDFSGSPWPVILKNILNKCRFLVKMAVFNFFH